MLKALVSNIDPRPRQPSPKVCGLIAVLVAGLGIHVASLIGAAGRAAPPLPSPWPPIAAMAPPSLPAPLPAPPATAAPSPRPAPAPADMAAATPEEPEAAAADDVPDVGP